METISAVLVDDEEHCTDMLKWMLDQYCPHVVVDQSFNDPAIALKYLQNHSPDVIFLDIEMPILNAFDLLLALGDLHGDVIFTTAYDEFAIKAIKYSALDYLLKPVDKDELMSAVQKVARKEGRNTMLARMDVLLNKVGAAARKTERIAIPTRSGLDMIDVEQIIHAKADDNYTEIHLEDGQRLLVSRTLKDVERDLPSDRFIRIHLSHVVAVGRIVRYVRGAGGYVVLPNGDQLPVSRSRKDDLMHALGA